MSELKAFTFGLGQYMEDGSPCVVAFDGEKNPRLASDEKFYLKSEVDAVISDKNVEIRRLKRALWLAHAYKAKFKRWWLHLALDCEASAIRPDTKTINRIKGKIGNCEKSERKCRDKAEANK